MGRPRAATPTYSLTVRPGGRYYIQWWEDGAARRISCRTTDEGTARSFLAAFQASLAAPVVPPAPTVRMVLEGYWTDRSSAWHSMSPAVAIKSLVRHLGDLPADMMNTERARYYVACRQKEGNRGMGREPGPLAVGTLRRELQVLRNGLSWGARNGWLTNVPRFDLPAAPPSRDRWLTRDEAARLLAAADIPHVRLFIALALFTGARRSAILDLTWNQVDLDTGRIDFGQARGKKRRARVPIAAPLLPYLTEAAQHATSPHVIEYGGARILNIAQGFNRAVKLAGLVGVTPHVCRHTAATWMAQRGVPLDQIAGFLGNSTAVVERVYRHHHPDFMQDAVEALSFEPPARGRNAGGEQRPTPHNLIP